MLGSSYIAIDDDTGYDIIKELIIAKKNIFITGSAGNGKTTLINKLINNIYNGDIYEYKIENIIISSSTGISGSHIKGTTIYNQLNMSYKQSNEEIIKGILMNENVRSKWVKCKIIILDEISLIDSDMMDRLNYIIQSLIRCFNLLKHLSIDDINENIIKEAIDKVLKTRKRKNIKPFGGINLIISGDFAQMSAISHNEDIDNEIKYTYKSEVWSKLEFNIIELINPKRHTDMDYFNILERMKFGNMTDDDHNILKSRLISKIRENNNKEIDFSKYTHLRGKRIDVIKLNNLILNKLMNSNKYNYDVIIKNNGKYNFNKNANNMNIINSTINKLPLQRKLTLCINAKVHLVVNLDQENGLVNGSYGEIVDFEYDHNNNEYYPKVKFENGIIKLIKRYKWNEYIYKYKTNITVLQIPLILSWTFTIHKSQGMTLDSICIPLNNDNIFQPQQAYVALSRVRSIDNLFLIDYDPSVIMVDEEVKYFYKEIKKLPNTVDIINNNTNKSLGK